LIFDFKRKKEFFDSERVFLFDSFFSFTLIESFPIKNLLFEVFPWIMISVCFAGSSYSWISML